MTRTRLLTGAVLTSAAVLLSSSPAWATTVDNGDFETPMTDPLFTANTSTLAGWTVTPNIDHVGTLWQAASGVQSVDLNGCQPGSLSQVVPTTAGSHTLVFSLSGNPDAGPVVKTLTVTVTSGANIATQNFTFDTTGASRPAMNWTTEQLPFLATGPSTITFESTTAGCYGPALDNVQVLDDPEIVVSEAPFAALLPASVAAVGALGALGWWRRRRVG